MAERKECEGLLELPCSADLWTEGNFQIYNLLTEKRFETTRKHWLLERLSAISLYCMSSQTGYIGLSSSFLQPFLSYLASISPANRHMYVHSHSLINSTIASIASHSSDLLLVHVLLQALVKVLPPFEQQRIADELEPRCEFQCRIVEHRLQSIGINVASVAYFVEIRLQVDLCFDEEDIVD